MRNAFINIAAFFAGFLAYMLSGSLLFSIISTAFDQTLENTVVYFANIGVLVLVIFSSIASVYIGNYAAGLLCKGESSDWGRILYCGIVFLAGTAFSLLLFSLHGLYEGSSVCIFAASAITAVVLLKKS